MITNITTTILLAALLFTVGATIVSDEAVSGSVSVSVLSEPSNGTPPPPQQ